MSVFVGVPTFLFKCHSFIIIPSSTAVLL